MALVYCCSLDGLIASIVLLICTSLWIKASAKCLNVVPLLVQRYFTSMSTRTEVFY